MNTTLILLKKQWNKPKGYLLACQKSEYSDNNK